MLEPVDITLHVNPVSLAEGGILGLLAIGLGWVAWNGVTISSGLGNRTQVFPALQDSPYWKGVVGKLTTRHFKGQRTEAEIQQERTNPTCLDLHARFNYHRRQGDETAAQADIAAGKAAGCIWAQSL